MAHIKYIQLVMNRPFSSSLAKPLHHRAGEPNIPAFRGNLAPSNGLLYTIQGNARGMKILSSDVPDYHWDWGAR
jgi:hypothetical protein